MYRRKKDSVGQAYSEKQFRISSGLLLEGCEKISEREVVGAGSGASFSVKGIEMHDVTYPLENVRLEVEAISSGREKNIS